MQVINQLRKLGVIILFIVTVTTTLVAQQIAQVAIIPQPQKLEQRDGSFNLNRDVKIYTKTSDPELRRLAQTLADDIEKRTGFTPALMHGTGKANSVNISLTESQKGLSAEAYTLTVDKDVIQLNAPAGAGIYYGIQTINKLLPATPVKRIAVSIPALRIEDFPRFEWRGLMLDVGRYYYPVSFIKKYIDYMSENKLNVFHWHLVEDGGWRIEIKKYPKLSTVSSVRDSTQLTKSPATFDHKIHQGYYTQDEIKDLIAYAKERYVTIVPEIEMPGHTMSSLAAYPELSCTGGPFKIPAEWKIRPDIYCAGNEKTFEFLQNVLTEVAELFPGQYIHIGGDEAPKDRWKVCQKCQARIKAEGLKDERELQSYFITRIEKFLEAKHKRLIGWDEILEGGLAPNAAVMSWRGVKGGIAAAKQHHDVVMTPNTNMYFDWYQGDRTLEPFAIRGYLYLNQVYNYEPVAAELSAEEAKFIKGVQANIWQEYIHTPEKVEYMTWPRASALAEVAWTMPGNKSWPRFQQKLETEYKRFEADGIAYARSACNPYQTVVIEEDGKATVSLGADAWKAKIYYTLDGSEPGPGSALYSGPFKVNSGTITRSVVFIDGKKAGKVLTKAALPEKK